MCIETPPPSGHPSTGGELKTFATQKGIKNPLFAQQKHPSSPPVEGQGWSTVFLETPSGYVGTEDAISILLSLRHNLNRSLPLLRHLPRQFENVPLLVAEIEVRLRFLSAMSVRPKSVKIRMSIDRATRIRMI